VDCGHDEESGLVIFLSSYSGESAGELFAMETTHRVDSLVLAFEQALQLQEAKRGFAALTTVEQDVLAIETLERDVNNGGYSQLFVNAPPEYVARMVDALTRIGCPETAALTARATAAASAGDDAACSACDGAYFGGSEDIASRLFAYLKDNRAALSIA
jgi:hypothetical protein